MVENAALMKSSAVIPCRKGIADMNHRVSEHTGYQAESEEDRMEQQQRETKAYIRRLNRELLVLWQYLISESLWEDAQEYLEDHRDDDLPFEATWTFKD